MKKSDLQKIIREELREALNELNSPVGNTKSNKEGTMYSDGLDAYINVGDDIILMNGTRAKILGIPTKKNPKFGKEIIVTTNAGKHISVDPHSDIKSIEKSMTEETKSSLNELTSGETKIKTIIQNNKITDISFDNGIEFTFENGDKLDIFVMYQGDTGLTFRLNNKEINTF